VGIGPAADARATCGPTSEPRPRKLSAETKWEVFLSVTTGEVTQAEAARNWAVDPTTVISIRRTVKDAALAALARRPGRPAAQRDHQLEAARAEISQLTAAITSQAIELAVVRGKARLRDVGTLIDRAPGGNPVHGL